MSHRHRGDWENITIFDSKVTATHSNLLPNGKVVYFHARYYPITSYLYTPTTNSLERKSLADLGWPGTNEPHAIFCAGQTFLKDGKLLVAGGERPRNIFGDFRGLKVAYIYNYLTETWSRAGSEISELHDKTQ